MYAMLRGVFYHHSVVIDGEFYGRRSDSDELEPSRHIPTEVEGATAAQIAAIRKEALGAIPQVHKSHAKQIDELKQEHACRIGEMRRTQKEETERRIAEKQKAEANQCNDINRAMHGLTSAAQAENGQRMQQLKSELDAVIAQGARRASESKDKEKGDAIGKLR